MAKVFLEFDTIEDADSKINSAIYGDRLLRVIEGLREWLKIKHRFLDDGKIEINEVEERISELMDGENIEGRFE